MRAGSSWLQPSPCRPVGQGAQVPTGGGAGTTAQRRPVGEDGAVSDSTPVPAQQPAPPGRALLTAYAAEQVLWMVPLVLGLVLFLVGGLLVAVWVGVPLVAAAI